MNDLASIRKEYSKASLDAKTAAKDPLNQFAHWFQEAIKAEVPEVNAMNLATVNENGRPASRIVLLKGSRTIGLCSTQTTRAEKEKELDENPACALTFFWPELERQIRVEGIAERIDEKRSEDYFQSRPRGSQVGAWASPQSSIISDRSLLEERAKQIEAKYKGEELLPKPNQWGGYEVDPLMVEFWQGRPSRLHDRILYTKDESGWKINRLAP